MSKKSSKPRWEKLYHLAFKSSKREKEKENIENQQVKAKNYSPKKCSKNREVQKNSKRRSILKKRVEFENRYSEEETEIFGEEFEEKDRTLKNQSLIRENLNFNNPNSLRSFNNSSLDVSEIPLMDQKYSTNMYISGSELSIFENNKHQKSNTSENNDSNIASFIKHEFQNLKLHQSRANYDHESFVKFSQLENLSTDDQESLRRIGSNLTKSNFLKMMLTDDEENEFYDKKNETDYKVSHRSQCEEIKKYESKENFNYNFPPETFRKSSIRNEIVEQSDKKIWKDIEKERLEVVKMLEDVMDTAKKGLDVDYESVRNVFKHYSTLEKKAKNQVNIENEKRKLGFINSIYQQPYQK